MVAAFESASWCRFGVRNIWQHLCSLMFAYANVPVILPAAVAVANIHSMMPGAQIRTEHSQAFLRDCPSWLSLPTSSVSLLYNMLAEDVGWLDFNPAVLKLSSYLFRITYDAWDEFDFAFIELARLNGLAIAIWVNARAFM